MMKSLRQLVATFASRDVALNVVGIGGFLAMLIGVAMMSLAAALIIGGGLSLTAAVYGTLKSPPGQTGENHHPRRPNTGTHQQRNMTR